MNALRKSIVIGLTVLGLGSAVLPSFAADEGRQGHAMSQQDRDARRAEFHAKRAEHFAKRQAALHDALKLTAAQEPAWAAYVAAIKPQAPAARGERGDWKAMSAPQRMEKRIAFSKQRIARMEAHLAATKSLYAALSPEQQKLFDENSKRGGRHGMKHRGMHRGHGDHGKAS